MDEITKGVVETTSVPENTEQLLKINIKDGKASALLFANPNGSKVKQRLDALEERFNNLKTINYEELYGPGNIDINSSSGDADKSYIDSQDMATLASAKTYADSKLTEARDYADALANVTLDQAKAYADSIGAGGGGGDEATVVLIDAVGRAASARSEAYEAYKAGKAIVVRVEEKTYIPMTVVFDSGTTASFKGIDFNYTGYALTPLDSLETRLWFLDSKGVWSNELITPRNSCRTFDCTTAYPANTFANALDAYNKGYPILLKVDANTYVIATNVTSTTMTGYSHTFNVGQLSDGQTGIASVDITRWRFTTAGVSRDTFSTENISGGGDGGGSTVTIRNAYSTNVTGNNNNDLPSNPDDDPTFWNQTAQTSSSVWAAQKSTGNDWVMWKLMPNNGSNGKDGNGIKNVEKHYVTSKSGTETPSYPTTSEGKSWTKTMPSANKGEYMWCRVSITYTHTAGESVYYTVSYIGVDGQDGAAGSPIAIKTERFDSKEGLPTEGANLGDAYIVGENLWVYNGNNIESEKTYRGFVNVGKFVGPAGKTGCFHVAWCNGDPANGDYTGFDIDAPDGSMFDYMGTYVDYVDSPEEAYNHPDSTDPTKYTWTKIRGVDGEDAVTLDFDNDSDGVGLTYEGLVDADKTITTNVGMFEGQKVMELISIECNAPEGMVVSTALTGSGVERYPGIINFSVKKGDSYIKSGSNNISVTVTARCTGSNKTHVITKSFHILGNKAGKPGESAVIYNIETSRDEIHKFSSGDYEVNFISVTKIYKQIGANPKEEYTGAYELRYDIDHQNQGYGNREKQTQCTVGYGVSVANVKVCLDFYLYIDGKPADHEHVEVHADGTIGEALKIVNTEYRYAVSMTFTKTPNDLTSWSTEPVDVEPGQYLFIEEKRYWSDGSVTYAYTWTRGGNNGYSNLPFISTVFTRSASAPSTPTGGTFDNPLPTSSDWSDGVPSGTAKLWMSHRKFTADGLPPQESEWSTPESALSSSDVTIKYSSFEECPKNPDVASSSSWVSIPNENSIWMAIQKIVDRVAQPWELRKIKGEKGSIDTSSASTPYMGEWRADGLYCGNKLRTDIVKVSGTDSPGEEATYYYIANKAKGFGLDNNGVCVGETTPKPGTTAGGSYWLKFSANFDNIATGLIFSEKVIADTMTAINAHIDQLDVNSLDAKIVNAINNGEGVINADKINTDNLVAKSLRTSDSGDRIIAESNRLSAFDENNNIIFDVEPMSNINILKGGIEDVVYKVSKTIYSRTFSGVSASSETSNSTFGSFNVPASDYVTVLGCDNLRVGIIATNTETTSKVRNITIVELYYVINSVETLFARCGLDSTINSGRMHICTMQYFNVRRNITSSTGVSIKAKVTHRAESGGQTSLTNATTIEVKILEGSLFVARRDCGVFVGNGVISGGQLNEYNHAILGSSFDGGKASLDVASNGVKMIVSDDIYVRHNGIGLLPLLNPVVIDISSNPVYNSEREISERDMFVIYNCFYSCIPVYIKTSVYLSDAGQFIDILARVSSVYSVSYTETDIAFTMLATADIHRMNKANWADSTDYRVNIFAERSLNRSLTYETASESLSSAYIVRTYIHTV